MSYRAWFAALIVVSRLVGGTAIAEEKQFRAGPSSDPSYFPIAVWLQDPARAERYKAVGINLYIGLWRGPTAEQLDQLDRAEMTVICSRSESTLKFKDRPTIVAWMHGDEPDNAQSLGRGKGYGPPIAPSKIIENYEKLRAADPDRPVFLNLGQGVAWDGYFGRGVRTNHPEDYAQYLKGCDIASFDIYPASHEKAEIAGKLEYVPKGVERLRRWSDDRKDVWCCIETTGINNPNVRPTPRQVRSEVWLALIHGAKGIVYFSHQFKPKFIEAGLLADEAMASGVAEINRGIKELAPVLNGPSLKDEVTVASSTAGVPIDHVAKERNGVVHVFAASASKGTTRGTFKLSKSRAVKIEVLGEGRTLDAPQGEWTDDFKDYEVHLYKVIRP